LPWAALARAPAEPPAWRRAPAGALLDGLARRVVVGEGEGWGVRRARPDFIGDVGAGAGAGADADADADAPGAAGDGDGGAARAALELMNRNAREPRKPNHGARPCSSVRRRRKNWRRAGPHPFIPLHRSRRPRGYDL